MKARQTKAHTSQRLTVSSKLLLLLVLLACSLLLFNACNRDETSTNENETLSRDENGKIIMQIDDERASYLLIKFFDIGARSTPLIRDGVAEIEMTHKGKFLNDDIAYAKVFNEKSGEEMTVGEDQKIRTFWYTDGSTGFYNRLYVEIGEEAGIYRLVFYGQNDEVLLEDVWNIDELIMCAMTGWLGYPPRLEDLPENYIYAIPDIRAESNE